MSFSSDPLNFFPPRPKTNPLDNQKSKWKKKKKKKQKKTSGNYDPVKLTKLFWEVDKKFGELLYFMDVSFSDFQIKTSVKGKKRRKVIHITPEEALDRTKWDWTWWTQRKKKFEKEVIMDKFLTVFLRNKFVLTQNLPDFFMEYWIPPETLEFIEWMWDFDISAVKRLREGEEPNYTLRDSVLEILKRKKIFEHMFSQDWGFTTGGEFINSNYMLRTHHYFDFRSYFMFLTEKFAKFFYENQREKKKLITLFHKQMNKMTNTIVPITLWNLKDTSGPLLSSGYLEYVSTPSRIVRGTRLLYSKAPFMMSTKELINTFKVLKESMSLYHIWMFIAELIGWREPRMFGSRRKISIHKHKENPYQFAVYNVLIPMLKEFKKPFVSNTPHPYYKYLETWVCEFMWFPHINGNYFVSNKFFYGFYYNIINDPYITGGGRIYNIQHHHISVVQPVITTLFNMFVGIKNVIGKPVKITRYTYKKIFEIGDPNKWLTSGRIRTIIKIVKIMTLKHEFQKLLWNKTIYVDNVDNEDVILEVNNINLKYYSDTLSEKDISRITGRMIYPNEFIIFKTFEEDEKSKMELFIKREKRKIKIKMRKEREEMDIVEKNMRKKIGRGMTNKEWRSFIKKERISPSREEFMGKRSLFQRERKRIESERAKLFTDDEWDKIVREIEEEEHTTRFTVDEWEEIIREIEENEE